MLITDCARCGCHSEDHDRSQKPATCLMNGCACPGYLSVIDTAMTFWEQAGSPTGHMDVPAA